jgi:hypothetical protein
MLLIIGTRSSVEPFPLEALVQIDAALMNLGYRKEVRSVVKPGREFSTTYEGTPATDKTRVLAAIMPIADRNNIAVTADAEESLRFP